MPLPGRDGVADIDGADGLHLKKSSEKGVTAVSRNLNGWFLKAKEESRNAFRSFAGNRFNPRLKLKLLRIVFTLQALKESSL